MINHIIRILCNMFLAIYALPIAYGEPNRVYKSLKLPVVSHYGVASWYGKQFKGKRTKSGDIFDPNRFTVAHRYLPVNTWVKVTNLKNGKAAIAEVNDKLPTNRNSLKKNVVVDVSLAIAKELDFVKEGLTKVKVEFYGRNKPIKMLKT